MAAKKVCVELLHKTIYGRTGDIVEIDENIAKALGDTIVKPAKKPTAEKKVEEKTETKEQVKVADKAMKGASNK